MVLCAIGCRGAFRGANRFVAYCSQDRWRILLVRFSDLTPGLVVRSQPRVVTQKEMIEFASRYDPQWFHVDVARASEGRWRGLIASGWHTCAIAMELMVRNVLSGSEAFGSPGIDTIKWQHPVRADDAVALHFEVLRSSKSPSHRTGIVLSKSELWNQNDRQVLTLQGTTLFDIATVAHKESDRKSSDRLSST